MLGFKCVGIGVVLGQRCVISYDGRSGFVLRSRGQIFGCAHQVGDDGRYSATGIGTISFQRESGKPFVLRDVMHVPGLKKNLISVAMLEDKGYDVVFSEGKAFLRSKTTGETRKIGVRIKNLYQLQVDGCATMACKAGEVVDRKSVV